jgi:hypothetical protein
MTVTDLSAAYQKGVGPSLKYHQHMLNIDFSGAEIFHNSDLGRILKPQRTGRIRRRVGAIGTDQSDYFWFKG